MDGGEARRRHGGHRLLGGPGAAAWDIADARDGDGGSAGVVVVGNASLVASPSFVIRAAPGTATMVPQQFLREEVYIAGNVKFEVRVDLADDAWVDGLADGTDAATRSPPPSSPASCRRSRRRPV